MEKNIKIWLKRLDNKILMSTKRGQFFETFVRWQLHFVIEYFLYPEFRKKRVFFKILKQNFLLVSIIILFVFTLSGFYFWGKSTQQNKINGLTNTLYKKQNKIERLHSSISQKDSTISELNTHLKSREYLEFIVWRDCKPEHFKNMQKLSDKIFFLMFEYADKYKIPYFILFGVIDRESGFKFIQNFEGSSAMGYMQVMEPTFKWLHKKLKLTGGHTEENNIKIGTYLLYQSYNFWRKRGYDDKKAWIYALGEFGAGKGALQILDKDGRVTGYYIPEYLNRGINRVMKHYK